MAFLFGRSKAKSTTADLLRQIKEQVAKLNGPEATAEVAKNEAAKTVAQMKLIMQGTHEIESSPEQVNRLVKGLIDDDMLLGLAANIHKLPFESRKDVQVILSAAFRFRPPGSSTTTQSDPFAVTYVLHKRPQVLMELCRAYDRHDSAIPAGYVLREMIKTEAAAAAILHDDGELADRGTGKSLLSIDRNQPVSSKGVFWKFFDWIDKSSFEVSADAFATFRDLLTKHKHLVSPFLTTNFNTFFQKYNTILVQSKSYVTKRQSIKLLGEILLDRANYSIMTTYIDSGEHLKITMNLLRSDQKMVQYEGFHVFKVFVANPHKSPPVQKILSMNRDKLLVFLQNFLDDRTDDEQFIDEREFLIKQIRNMPPPTMAC